MKYPIIRSVLIGVLAGVLLFVAFRLVLIILLIAAIYKLSGAGRRRRAYWRKQKLVYVENIRNMNEEDFAAYKSNFNHGCQGAHRNQNYTR